jgi:hypothetical protein
MKKAYLFFVCAVALFNYGYTQWNNDGNFKCWNDELIYKVDNLKGKVKSYTFFCYRFEKESGGVEQKKLFGKGTYCYDSLGNRTKESHFEPNGDLSIYNTYKYNEDGYLIEDSAVSGYTGPMHVISNIYDTKNNVVEYKFSGLSSPITCINSFNYKYDLNGNVIEKTVSSYYDGKSGWLTKYNYRYNLKGSLVETVTFLNGVLQTKEILKYDLKSRPLEWIQFDSYGKQSFRFIHKYDTRGNIAEEIEYKYGVIKRRIFFKYDNNNNIIKTIFNLGIKYPLVTEKYEYDEGGNCIKKISDAIPGFSSGFIYERKLEFY